MRSTITGLALASVLLAAPVAFAQNQAPGTIGTPSNPGGGSTTLAQGTPGTSPGGMNSGNSAAPSTTSPNAGMPSVSTPRTEPMTPGSGGATNATGGNTVPGTNNPPTTATPAAGANSFTEGQARSRIEAAGYSDVQNLRKDDQGVWRAQGMRNGTRADVGLDFKGDVVTGSAPAAR